MLSDPQDCWKDWGFRQRWVWREVVVTASLWVCCHLSRDASVPGGRSWCCCFCPAVIWSEGVGTSVRPDLSCQVTVTHVPWPFLVARVLTVAMRCRWPASLVAGWSPDPVLSTWPHAALSDSPPRAWAPQWHSDMRSAAFLACDPGDGFAQRM